jgi:ribonuclease HII
MMMRDQKLSEKRRAALDAEIKSQCRWSVGIADVGEIDRINILQATMLAMTRAVDGLFDKLSLRHPREGGDPSDNRATSNGLTMDPRLRRGDETIIDVDDIMVLVDGNRLPTWSYTARAIIGGDALEPCISAASIIAKQHRDALMIAADAEHPGYGWASNKGYGSAQHLAALRLLGPTPLHRRSFAPVAQHFFAL